MYLLTAAVVIVGLLCLLDLILTLGVIRRLREHTETLAQLSSSGRDGIAPGTVVGDIHGRSITGTAIDRTFLTGGEDTVIGFFSPGCGPCKALLPEYLSFVSDIPSRVLTVIVGDHDAASEYVEALAGTGEIVVESPPGAIAQALGVDGYPTICMVDNGGRVVAAGASTRTLRAYAAAT
ncbi:hypothetical protein Rhe02_42070 [Rhizocola hellebori]|uniref:Thioredoxin domain-containing protein n=1 Tax=Rhizocola hellebori TaxID=1392758 RepID=A0A8J3QAQ4_9ACTN|nr:thioredoxin domain-containing protein [Rhizocola hellebori]GIH06140.1 hypothetical protein Rhe02_42070 [Rhizocola hellebori]